VNFSVRCRTCDHELVVTDKQLGKSTRCPGCSSVIKLPAPVGLGPKLKAPPPVNSAGVSRDAKKLPTFAMACPACGARMRLLDKYYGTIVRCPDCNEPFQAGEGPVEEPGGESSSDDE
jgi:DNA-directed RNA polymerase subunit RPC12/RpoP